MTGRHDPLGLSAWGVIGVVRALSRRLPAFEVPLDSGAHAPNAAGAKAVLTWRYGAKASTARAGDAGGSPAEAIDLVATGAVDAILALGRLPPHVDEVISTGINPRGVIRIAPDAPAGAHDGVWVPCRELFDEAGTLLRSDGRTVELAGSADDSLPSAVVLLAALRERLVAPQTTETEGGKA